MDTALAAAVLRWRVAFARFSLALITSRVRIFFMLRVDDLRRYVRRLRYRVRVALRLRPRARRIRRGAVNRAYAEYRELGLDERRAAFLAERGVDFQREDDRERKAKLMDLREVRGLERFVEDLVASGGLTAEQERMVREAVAETRRVVGDRQ